MPLPSRDATWCRKCSSLLFVLVSAVVLAGCGGEISPATPTVVTTSSSSNTPSAAPTVARAAPTITAAAVPLSVATNVATATSVSIATVPLTANTDNAGKTTITSLGSTALLPLVQEAAKQFGPAHPDIAVLVDGGGSGAGLTRVAAGEVNIGNSDIYAAERAGIDAASLVDHQICGQGFAIAANKDVSVDGLTQQQASAIFTGKITNWQQVGGSDQPIKLISRPKGSGTRTTFDRIVLNGGQSAGSVTEANGINLTEDSSATVAKAISDNPGAVGYLGLAYFNTSSAVKKLKYNGVEATTDNIIAGSYAIWSYGHMYTKGQPDPAAQTFIDFILSDKFQNETVGKFNYIPVSKLKNVKAP